MPDVGSRAVTVLGTNSRAIALYCAAGYREEGRLEGQFLLDGRYVDDVFMALVTLGGPDGPAGP